MPLVCMYLGMISLQDLGGRHSVGVSVGSAS